MTQQDDITQRWLTIGEILAMERRSNMTDDEALRFGRAIETKILSKLRAPVADERAALNQILHSIRQARIPGNDWRRELALIENTATAALASAPVATPIQWPTMPASKGQSPVLFEDGYAEGWAKCMDECQRAASAASAPVAGEARPVACLRRQIDGSDWGHWKPGSVEDGQRVTGLRSWQVRWLVDAAPQASDTVGLLRKAAEALAGYRREMSLLQAEDTQPCDAERAIIAALKQPQADKDGGQQHAADAYQIGDLVMGHAEGMRVSSPLKTSRGFGTDIEHRFEISDGVDRFGVFIILTKLKSLTAALSATQAEQGERDA